MVDPHGEGPIRVATSPLCRDIDEIFNAVLIYGGQSSLEMRYLPLGRQEYLVQRDQLDIPSPVTGESQYLGDAFYLPLLRYRKRHHEELFQPVRVFWVLNKLSHYGGVCPARMMRYAAASIFTLVPYHPDRSHQAVEYISPDYIADILYGAPAVASREFLPQPLRRLFRSLVIEVVDAEPVEDLARDRLAGVFPSHDRRRVGRA